MTFRASDIARLPESARREVLRQIDAKSEKPTHHVAPGSTITDAAAPQAVRCVTITLPLPAKPLSPNWRGHWAVKAKAKKEQRIDACAQTMLAMGFNRGWKAAMIVIRFYWTTKHRHDSDNALASLKSAIDGIVDSGLLADDDLITYLPIVNSYDHDNPRVEIEAKENA